VYRSLVFLIVFILEFSCGTHQKNETELSKSKVLSPLDSMHTFKKDSAKKLSDTLALNNFQDTVQSSIEKIFISESLVDVQVLDSTIKVRLMYATKNNFTKVNLYGNLKKCYLPKFSALKLLKAQKALREANPGYSLLIWDATRPCHIQRVMWDTLKLPFKTKINYLAHPDSISLHNFGAAVDLTVLNEQGKELDMGTGFDFFGELAEPRFEIKLLAENKLSQVQIDNRNILRTAMKKGGYWPVPTEWWHFNSVNKKWAIENLKLIK
jgi:D-alanyl-D-alanine dipeptidase